MRSTVYQCGQSVAPGDPPKRPVERAKPKIRGGTKRLPRLPPGAILAPFTQPDLEPALELEDE
jgi:hypothetical protein